MDKYLFWREGILAYRNEANFSMNPYSPGPKPNCGYLPKEESMKNLWWCNGYWWADKHK